MSWGLIVKLHQALGVDLVRLCANLETISTHLFGGVGKVNLVFFYKSEMQRTWTRIRGGNQLLHKKLLYQIIPYPYK